MKIALNWVFDVIVGAVVSFLFLMLVAFLGATI